MTTTDATFLGVALVARAARAGVAVPGGTYSGSCSSSETITSRADGATNFKCHVRKLDLVLVPLEILPMNNHY